MTDNGLLTFRTIYLSVRSNIDADYTMKDFHDSWKLISNAPTDILSSITKQTTYALILICVLILIIGIIALILSYKYHHLKLKATYLELQNISYSRFVPHEFLNLFQENRFADVKLTDSIQMPMTILFSDMRSYTQISESMQPKEIFHFLSDYYLNINPSIIMHDGFIDKFLGDAIMVLFPKSPEHALRAAIEMKCRLKSYNNERKRKGHIPIRSGFGLHYGEVTLGTFGTLDRMDTTVIGDTVNLTSRLETLTKVFKVDIILSHTVHNKLINSDCFCLREIDTVRVKGKQEPVVIYESFDTDEPNTIDQKLESLTLFHEALCHYRKGDFRDALSLFKQCLDLCPEDSIPPIYITRCNTLLRIPPGPNWAGISTL